MPESPVPLPPPAGQAIELVRKWLEQVVVGLNLCPFARGPWTRGEIRLVVCPAGEDSRILECLDAELEYLADTPRSEAETTVIILTGAFQDFLDYNDFLGLADERLSAGGWEGVFQLASFHPAYQFAGTQPEDVENLTNRAPYPLLHLLREESVSEAVDSTLDPDEIPRRNIARMQSLKRDEIRTLFPWVPPQQPES
jgi:hypothetical protein